MAQVSRKFARTSTWQSFNIVHHACRPIAFKFHILLAAKVSLKYLKCCTYSLERQGLTICNLVEQANAPVFLQDLYAIYGERGSRMAFDTRKTSELDRH